MTMPSLDIEPLTSITDYHLGGIKNEIDYVGKAIDGDD